MMWKKCELINSEITEQDRLNNDIKADKAVQSVFGRFTPFNETDLKLEGRTVTKNSRKVIIRTALPYIKPCEKIKIDGLLYQIKEKSAAGRFALFYIERIGVN